MSKVFEPITLGGMEIRNRIVRSATNDYAGNEDGTVSAFQMDIYKQLAKNEVGLIITGHVCVSPDGRNDPRQNGMYDDKFVEGQRQLVEMVHQYGAKIIQQLNHSGAKCPPAVIGGTPSAPSAVEVVPGVLPHALTEEEILRIENDFTTAAVRAQKAGFDGVQIHCAHGYLFSQFIDPAHNKRTDRYGGSAENRFRIVAETLAKVREAVGPSYPVFLKIHTNAAAGDETFEADLVEMLRTAQSLGATAAELSGFDFAAQPRGREGRLYYLERASRVCKAVSLPCILVGGIRTIEEMAQVLDAGLQMVSLSRPFICQPDIIPILKAGGASKCIGCFGCFKIYQTDGKRCVLH